MGKSKYETHVLPKLELIKGWCRDGLTDENISKNLGIDCATFYRYKKQYCEFCDALKSKEEADYVIENALFENAKSGNITAQIFWLKNRRPDKWRDKVEVKDERDVNAFVTIIDDVPENGEEYVKQETDFE